MAAPDLRAAVRHGAAHLEKMAVELEHLEHGGHAGGNRYADLQHRFEVLGGYTLDQRVDEALSRPRLRPRRVAAPADGAVRRPADPRGPRAPGGREPGPADARRAHEPPRHQRDRVAGGAPPAALRGAARRLPRPRLPGRDGDPRLGAAGPPPHRVPRRLLRLPPPARGARPARREGRRVPVGRRWSARWSWSSATAASASTPRCTSTRRASRSSRRTGSRRRASPPARCASTGTRSRAGRSGPASSSCGWTTSPWATCRAAGRSTRTAPRRRSP